MTFFLRLELRWMSMRELRDRRTWLLVRKASLMSVRAKPGAFVELNRHLDLVNLEFERRRRKHNERAEQAAMTGHGRPGGVQ